MKAQAGSEGRILATTWDHSRVPEVAGVAHPQDNTPPSPPDVRHVLSIRACVERSDLPSFIGGALQEIRAHIIAHHVQVLGPPFSISRPTSSHGVDVEVGWPVDRSHGVGRIASGLLPVALIRCSHDGTCAESQDLHRVNQNIPPEPEAR